jgi:hypothetical protein
MLRKIGFIGLGTVGRHMAVNLAKANYELTVFDLDAAVVREVTASGAKASSSAFEAAKGRDLVITIVSEDDELGPFFFSEKGILAGIDSWFRFWQKVWCLARRWGSALTKSWKFSTPAESRHHYSTRKVAPWHAATSHAVSHSNMSTTSFIWQ